MLKHVNVINKCNVTIWHEGAECTISRIGSWHAIGYHKVESNLTGWGQTHPKSTRPSARITRKGLQFSPQCQRLNMCFAMFCINWLIEDDWSMLATFYSAVAARCCFAPMPHFLAPAPSSCLSNCPERKLVNRIVLTNPASLMANASTGHCACTTQYKLHTAKGSMVLVYILTFGVYWW